MSTSLSQNKMFSTFYNELTALRAAVSAIPFIGTYLDLTLSLPGQQFVEERLEYLVKELNDELQDLKIAVIDNRFLQTEEGYDLITKTFLAAAKTRQRTKLKLFAKILRGAYTQKQTQHDPELYIRIIDDLSAREIEVAFLLYNVRIASKKDFAHTDGELATDAYFFSRDYPQFSKDELEFIFPRLEKTGLVKEMVGSYLGYMGGHYDPTPLLGHLITYIGHNE